MSSATLPETPTTTSPLYVAQDVAALLRCSVRNVWALNDRAAIPGEVRIGRLVRWRQRDVHQWIENGCPEQK
jgi:predicted DNA-binding transcriptional regulator AlpA